MSRFRQIYSWVEANKPHTIAEIGTWNGHNAARMMNEGAKKYIGFDLWEDGEEVPGIDELEFNAKKRVTEKEARFYLKSFDIELIKGNTRETLPEYVKGRKHEWDMVVIDGGHSRGTIKSDLLTILNSDIMKPDGSVFMDDYYYNCKIDNVGAQSVLCHIQVPYTILPVADKGADGSLIKLVHMYMRDVPRGLKEHDVPEESAWQFNPAA